MPLYSIASAIGGIAFLDVRLLRDQRFRLASGRYAGPILDRALQVEGFTKRSELELLRRLASEMPPNALVVEVGSHRGRSTIAIAAGLEAVAGARLFAVDPFTGDPSWQGKTDATEARRLFERNTKALSFLEVVQAPSVEAAGRFESSSVDWVFIDGLHDYRSVCEDIRAWSPKMKPGGLMSGHDYGRAGVTDAVLTYFQRHDVEHSIWMTSDEPHLQPSRWLKSQVKRALKRA